MLLEREHGLDITTARTVRDLEALASEWHQLWLRDPTATPFQSPAWLIPWAKHFTSDELCSVVVRTAGRLVALIPAFTWTDRAQGERKLLLLGTGISDYCGGVFEPRTARAAATAGMQHLRACFDWDLLLFEDLRAGSPLLGNGATPSHVVPVLDLRESIPKAQRQNVRYYQRRAERLGRSEWRIAGADSLDTTLDRLFALHSARWRDAGDAGVLADDAVQAFHREAARALLELGILQLSSLTIGTTEVAVLYALASHGRTYYYISGFDPECAPVSPGTLILARAIEQATRQGCTHFDFLRGAERYKYLWGANDTQTFRRVERRASSVENWA